MKKFLCIGVLVCAVLAPGAAPSQAADETFSFYGLRFGTPRAEIAKQTQLTGSLVRNPGHGLSDLELVFDREDVLVEIRAGWPRPEDPLVLQGLMRALREKFIAPTSARFPAIAVTVDEYSNRAAIRVVFIATNIREKNIEHHKNEFLKTLQ